MDGATELWKVIRKGLKPGFGLNPFQTPTTPPILLEPTNQVSKVAGYKINMQNRLHFYTLTMDNLSRELEKYVYNHIKKTKIPRKKPNHGGERLAH